MPVSARPLIGWPLLPLPDEHGQLHFPSLETSIRESIIVILSTTPGEQLMRPEFGSGLRQFLNEPNTITTRRRIRDRVVDALERWEKRIELQRIDVADVPDQPTRVRVDLFYRIRRTGTVHRLGVSIDTTS
ncbi:MAG: baseplate assembly protein [Nitrospirae bacterium]|nr:MAG: baseplate assembly protein [Nitrospirota bacterium]